MNTTEHRVITTGPTNARDWQIICLCGERITGTSVKDVRANWATHAEPVKVNTTCVHCGQGPDYSLHHDASGMVGHTYRARPATGCRKIEPLVMRDASGHLTRQECATCGRDLEAMPRGWRHL